MTESESARQVSNWIVHLLMAAPVHAQLRASRRLLSVKLGLDDCQTAGDLFAVGIKSILP